MKKLYIGSDNKVVLTCPGCDKTKMIDVSHYLTSDGPVKLTYRFQCDTCKCGHSNCQECIREKCTLGHVNTLLLERRKTNRKNLSLVGSFTMNGTDVLKVNILNISRKGVLIGCSSAFHFVTGWRGFIDFYLDDPNKTHIRKEALVERCASNNTAVLMFVEENVYSTMDKAIGFYLMNTK